MINRPKKTIVYKITVKKSNAPEEVNNSSTSVENHYQGLQEELSC